MFENSSTQRLLVGLSEALREAAPFAEDAFARRQILGTAHVLAAMAPQVQWAAASNDTAFEKGVWEQATALGWSKSDGSELADALAFVCERSRTEPDAREALGTLIEALSNGVTPELDRSHGT
jgi:hypothetical protein